MKCEACGGIGKFRQSTFNAQGFPAGFVDTNCETCHGSGQTSDTERQIPVNKVLELVKLLYFAQQFQSSCISRDACTAIEDFIKDAGLETEWAKIKESEP